MSDGVACLGYVNLDHVVAVTRAVEPGVTSLVSHRYSVPAGRLGGCAANIALGLAEACIEVDLLSWVGTDPAAARVTDELEAGGVGIAGVARDPDRRTGTTWLPSAPTGETYCVYDPGGASPRTLTNAQRERLHAHQRLVVTVGPPGPCAEALDLLRDQGFLLWAVKADPGSFPAALVGRLAARADVIVHNEQETAFLVETLGEKWGDRVRPDALVVRTRGAGGAEYRCGATAGSVAASEALDVPDAIGAGDRFCAGLLAGLIGGLDAGDAVGAGIESAERLLHARGQRQRIADR